MDDVHNSREDLEATPWVPGSGVAEIRTKFGGIVIDGNRYSVEAWMTHAGHPIEMTVKEYHWNGGNSGRTGKTITDPDELGKVERVVMTFRDRMTFDCVADDPVALVKVTVQAPWISSAGPMLTRVTTIVDRLEPQERSVGRGSAQLTFASSGDDRDDLRVARRVAEEFTASGAAVSVSAHQVLETSAREPRWTTDAL